MGENFEIISDGRVQNLGFFATRFVKANSDEEAEYKAVELIKNDSSLKSMMADNSKLTPKIYLEGLSSARWWKKLGGEGYSFFNMEED